ncbi:hypothetical protein [Rhodopila sp.]|uniref:hypothetical protein n=1 Tax=Rhodopila sp. TaxID=2480087 RepID=UPI003D13DC22
MTKSKWQTADPDDIGRYAARPRRSTPMLTSMPSSQQRAAAKSLAATTPLQGTPPDQERLEIPNHITAWQRAMKS